MSEAAEVVDVSKRYRRAGEWDAILEEAAAFVRELDPVPVTLRQVFYHLLSRGRLYKAADYRQLSSRSAAARRAGWFPALADETRGVSLYQTWASARDAVVWTREAFRVDRTEGQSWRVFLGVEKRTMIAQLRAWFGHLGLPVVAFAGFTSQTLADEVAADIALAIGREGDDRPAVLLYVGDLDPSGAAPNMGILADAIRRIGAFDKVERVALNPDQREALGLSILPAKDKDARLRDFYDAFGYVGQTEVEAVPVPVLRDMWERAIERYHDRAAFEAILEVEAAERHRLGPDGDAWRA